MQEKHALVIGGTGMLSDVSAWLIKKGYIVTVIGRRNETYHRLLQKVDKRKNLKSILVDYHNTEKLKSELLESIEYDGAFDVIVAWVHSSAPNAIPTVLQLASQTQKDTFDFFHVKSSTSYINKNTISVPENGKVHDIYLGFKIIGSHSRWLTNEEICAGVMDSIHHKRKETVVGVLEPWDRRPS